MLVEIEKQLRTKTSHAKKYTGICTSIAVGMMWMRKRKMDRSAAGYEGMPKKSQ
jgi:hypothetical protein